VKLWDRVRRRLRLELEGEEYRRWFAESNQASDSGDQITVWVPSETARRHIIAHYQEVLDRVLESLDRGDVEIRWVATGVGDEEADGEEG
jgi:chromosomal replication initiation ATPase DnaA